MTNSFLKQSIFISFLGHITLFSIFSFSFGPRIPELSFPRVCFWGSILRKADLTNNRNIDYEHQKGSFSGKSEIAVLDKFTRGSLLSSREYIKPPISLTFNQEKIIFVRKLMPVPFITQRKEPVIMFYPRLPHYFTLYFKDRQTVHIELMFQIISGNKDNSVLVKRRISSGNLEADLLSMRYISRYLFIQQRGFAPDKWRVVNIDLSTIND